MRSPFVLSCLALGALGVSVSAQEPPVTESVPPIEILTSDPAIVASVMSMFPSDAETASMELAEGQVFALTVSPDRKAEVRQVQGSGWFDLRMRPGAVLQMFEKEAERYRQMAQAMGGMALAQQGVPFEAVAEMAEAAFTFPEQIDALHLNIDQNPAGGQAMKLSLRIDPRMETWFGELVASLRPNPSGVRILPEGDAPMRASISLDLAKALPHLRPVMEKLTGMSIQDPEAREKALLVSREFYDSMSGSASIIVDPGSGLTWLGGLADPGKAKDLLHSERYAEVEMMLAEAMPDAEVRMDMNAFTHREVPVMSRTIDAGNAMGAGAMPGGGEMTAYYAVTGDSLVVEQFGAKPDNVKATIDAVLDGELERVELGEGVLMTADMRVADFMSAMAAEQGMPLTEDDLADLPARARVRIEKKGTGLQIEVRTE